MPLIHTEFVFHVLISAVTAAQRIIFLVPEFFLQSLLHTEFVFNVPDFFFFFFFFCRHCCTHNSVSSVFVIFANIAAKRSPPPPPPPPPPHDFCCHCRWDCTSWLNQAFSYFTHSVENIDILCVNSWIKFCSLVSAKVPPSTRIIMLST